MQKNTEMAKIPENESVRRLAFGSIKGLLFLLDMDPAATDLNREAWALSLKHFEGQDIDIKTLPLGILLVSKNRDFKITPATNEEIASLLFGDPTNWPFKLDNRDPKIVTGAIAADQTTFDTSILSVLADQCTEIEIPRFDAFFDAPPEEGAPPHELGFGPDLIRMLRGSGMSFQGMNEEGGFAFANFDLSDRPGLPKTGNWLLEPPLLNFAKSSNVRCWSRNLPVLGNAM